MKKMGTSLTTYCKRNWKSLNEGGGFLNYFALVKRTSDKNAFQYHPLQWPSGGGGGVCPGGGVCQGVSDGRGCLPLGLYTSRLWKLFLTRACENITFPQLRLRTVKI